MAGRDASPEKIIRRSRDRRLVDARELAEGSLKPKEALDASLYLLDRVLTRASSCINLFKLEDSKVLPQAWHGHLINNTINIFLLVSHPWAKWGGNTRSLQRNFSKVSIFIIQTFKLVRREVA
jgi:hypothetical protein